MKWSALGPSIWQRPLGLGSLSIRAVGRETDFTKPVIAVAHAMFAIFDRLLLVTSLRAVKETDVHIMHNFRHNLKHEWVVFTIYCLSLLFIHLCGRSLFFLFS